MSRASAPKVGAFVACGPSPILCAKAPEQALSGFLLGAAMADLRLQRRDEVLEGDREALEHIARALEGRVLPGPGAAARPGARDPAEALALTPQSLKLLLESVPAAIGILAEGGLVHVNNAFAYAFGYRSASEFLEAGGLDAVLADAAALIHQDGAERSAPIDALTRSRRRLKVAFASTPIDAEGNVKLLRLIDQTSLDEETLPSPSLAEPTPASEDTPKLEADAATGRVDFLAKVSHEVRTPLNSIIGFTELMLQERFGAIANQRYKGYIE